MRAALVTTVLILASACSFERGTSPAPQPQKSALSICPIDHDGGRRSPCEKPIFVVDGKRLIDESVDLNPSEIATVEVFKGPLAVATYGEDARNGVVVITTKRALNQEAGRVKR